MYGMPISWSGGNGVHVGGIIGIPLVVFVVCGPQDRRHFRVFL